MTKEDLRRIVDDVQQLTLKKALNWQRNGDEEEERFRVNFPHSSVEIWSDQDDDSPIATLVIYNDNGLIVGCVSKTDYEASELPPPWIYARYLIQDVNPLFNAVKEQVYKYSETAQSLLEELSALKAKEKLKG